MKKVYAIVLFASCLFMTASAQSQISVTKLTPVEAASISQSNNPMPLSTTTLVPTSHSYTCAASQYYYRLEKVAPWDTGYAFGTSIFGETECAQRYNAYTGTISDVLVRYGKKAGTTGSTYGEIYTINPTTKAPQTLSGTSAAITTGSITTSGYTDYVFSPAITVTNGFYAAIKLPTTAGDTVVILVNQLGCSTTDSLAWENFSPGGWWSVAYNYGVNTDLNILAVGNINTGVNEYSSNGLSLLGAYPNPASDVTNLRYRLDEPSTVSVEVFDLTGRVIEKSSNYFSAGAHDIKVSLKGVAAGNYYYTIKAGGAQLTSKFVVTK